MTANIINGKEVAAKIKEEIKEAITVRIAKGKRPPGLAVIMVGSNSASEVYVRHKRLACEHVGIFSVAYDLPNTASQKSLLDLIDELNNDPRIDGILVQLPLPDSMNADEVLDRIRPDKDVDGFHPFNIGCLAQRRPILRPCTPYGIITLLQHTKLDISGMNAVVAGASNIVGRPMALELLLAKCTVTICHSATRDLAYHVKNADLLVVAIGNPNVVKSEWIKPGAIIIDVGIHRLANGKLIGDIDFDTAKERAGWITRFLAASAQ